MSILRIDASDDQYSPKNTRIFSLHSSHLNGRADVSCYSELIGSKARDVNATSIPVIFLLHGVYGSHWSWLASGGINRVYDSLRQNNKINQMLLVMPSDGLVGDGSGYLSEIEGKNIENFLVEDLVLALKEQFTFIDDDSNFYIAGLSMGGYGAMRVGTRNSSFFKGISALSACTRLEDLRGFIHNKLPKEKDCDDLVYLFQQNKKNLPPLRFDCGREDDLLTANENLHSQLLENDIAHEFKIYGGGHTWEYWHQHIGETLVFFAEIERAKNK